LGLLFLHDFDKTARSRKLKRAAQALAPREHEIFFIFIFRALVMKIIF
jgi:hypothetical protein